MKIALMGINRDGFDTRKDEYGFKNWANFFAHYIYFTKKNSKYGGTMGELKLSFLNLDDESLTDSYRMGMLSTHNYELCILDEYEYNLIAFHLWKLQKADIDAVLIDLWKESKELSRTDSEFPTTKSEGIQYAVDAINQIIIMDI
jgi:hypothetical protein